MPYHIIARRLIEGSFLDTGISSGRDVAFKMKVNTELRWLGMTRLAEELGASQNHGTTAPILKHKRSGVITGGQGYI
jgi:hypothetical protein